MSKKYSPRVEYVKIDLYLRIMTPLNLRAGKGCLKQIKQTRRYKDVNIYESGARTTLHELEPNKNMK